VKAEVGGLASQAADLVVVIVNYRTGKLVIDCLASLAPEIAAHPGVHVLIVDNASNDGSDLLLQDALRDRGWNDWARLHRSDVNGGFAYANNIAIAQSLASCSSALSRSRALIWMLNPDTLVRPGAVGHILRFMQAHPHAGAIGTAIEDASGDLWPYAFRFHSLAGELENALRSGIATRLLRDRSLAQKMAKHATQVDWVSGASMVLRGAVFETTGMFDEDYFLYFEETDFFHRVARAGWERWYVPQARVQHISGQSTGLTAHDAARRRVPAYWHHSRRRYLVKNHGRAYAVVTDLITLLGIAIWRLRCVIRRRPHGASPHFVRDFLRYSAMAHLDIRANAALASATTTGPSPLAANPVARSI